MPATNNPASLALTEDEVDDLLYLARANETQDLPQYLQELSQSHAGSSTADIVVAAVDEASGNSALHYAAANGHTEILDIIRNALTSAVPSPDAVKESYKSFVNLKNSAGNTALHWAALNGHLSAVKTLVALGADATILNAAGHDAVFEAEQNGKNDVVGWLLVEGGALDTVVGALKDEEVAESSKNGARDDDEGEDVEMKISMGDTSESGVEKGVENLQVDDAKAKEKASG
ncbi:putative ankyrin repeat containing protein yar1 protein [Lasiodiplodia theobromae]|uniref:Ankyrin repeat-containing protein YAR1 n=1 Tax=Lasiodiplodia theobromae TaxID=45133 RepID=A0A5N5DKP7_9PEZI|nr:Ankyrin repeat protein [Lasiodiplodia theobromae]KAB2578170.1 Ankyrin repeat-containing protein YAR1 [Lasiodiplodia theobromae]KAF4544177.1 Ankyrin repeat protein [Lasiodiplodia theobromae]KAF9641333.1 putative ankyrin repeat containing protein yar1 protein [Lasiodiplodia theobromae]